MALYDKRRRKLEKDQNVVLADVPDVPGVVLAVGTKYVRVRFPNAGAEEKLTSEQLLIVQKIDGKWVADWDRPRPKPGCRIAWARTSGSGTGVYGYVGGIHLFTITYSLNPAEDYIRRSHLPGIKDETGGSVELRERAEVILEEWLTKLGAVFPDRGAKPAKERVKAFLEARAYTTRGVHGTMDKNVVTAAGNADGEAVELLRDDLERLVEGQ